MKDERRISGSHTTRVVNDLGVAIVSGRLAQGAFLPGDVELLRQFGVSRTVLREAVKMLSGKGLLQSKARRGTWVRERGEWNLFDPDVLTWHAAVGLSPEFLEHLGEMRLALEPEAAALAAKRRTPDELAAMHLYLDRMGAAGIEQDAFVRADLGLHHAIAAAARNPFMLSVATLVEVALVAMLTISSPVESRRRLNASVAEHRAMVDAIEAKDAEAARAAMRVVIHTGIAHSRKR